MINPLSVAVEGFGFGELSEATDGWLSDIQIFPGAGIWYVPSDIIIKIVHDKHYYRHTYKIWPIMEKVVATFEGSESYVAKSSVKAELLYEDGFPTKVIADMVQEVKL